MAYGYCQTRHCPGVCRLQGHDREEQPEVDLRLYVRISNRKPVPAMLDGYKGPGGVRLTRADIDEFRGRWVYRIDHGRILRRYCDSWCNSKQHVRKRPQVHQELGHWVAAGVIVWRNNRTDQRHPLDQLPWGTCGNTAQER